VRVLSWRLEKENDFSSEKMLPFLSLSLSLSYSLPPLYSFLGFLLFPQKSTVLALLIQN
jgi:hypothetical protein